MVRRLIHCLTILLVTLCISLPAYASPRVALDGKILKFDTPPVIESGTTLVPLRQIFESLGASVSWNDAAGQITAQRDLTSITLTVGSNEARVDNKKVSLLVPPKIIDGRTLVPLRFISESLGATVLWDQVQEIAVIKSAKPLTVEEKTPVGKLAKVHFINLGSADAVYISLPDKTDILIDSGKDGQFRELPQKVVSYLQDQGVDDIDVLVVSAPLKDYLGYMDKVFSNFTVEKVIESGKDNPIQEYIDFKFYSLKSTSVATANRQHFDFSGITFDILSTPGHWDDIRDDSVVAKLTYNDVSFLFTGAASVKKSQNLSGDVSAKILKVADHGSQNSVSKEFLDRVKPEVSVITVGSNPFGWPHKDTLSSLENTSLYRTDRDGDIMISTDGRVYDVASENQKETTSQPQQQTSSYIKYVGDIEKNIYHKYNCPLAQEIKPANKYTFNYAFDAANRGFTPCMVCN